MTRLVLVRHGQSEWNVERRIQGQGGTGLTSLGAEQAAGTAAWIAETYPDAEVWVSDLQRCQETAAPLLAALKVSSTDDIRLRERDFGDWTAQLVDDLAGLDPDRAARWQRGEDVIGEVGGESSADLTGRVVEVINEAATLVGAGGVLVCVTHGGPVWHATHGLLGLAVGTLGGVANAGVTEIALEGPVPVLISWNQTAHLAPHLRTSQRQVIPADERPSPPVGR